MRFHWYRGARSKTPCPKFDVFIDRGLDQVPSLRIFACARVKWCDERNGDFDERNYERSTSMHYSIT